MNEDPLKVIATEKSEGQSVSSEKPSARHDALRAKFERQWLLNPEQFNPSKDCLKMEQFERTWDVIQPYLKEDQHAVDLGFGWGESLIKLSEKGVKVDAVETSGNAIKNFRNRHPDLQGIQFFQATLPETNLEDGKYDLVLCADLIAELHPYDQRILISELARLVKTEGYVFISTPFDTKTEGAWEKFAQLCGTEFLIKEWHFGYHSYYLRLKKILGNRSFLDSQKSVNALERVNKFLNPEDGISHAIYVCQKKPLEVPEPVDMSTVCSSSQKLRRRVWE